MHSQHWGRLQSHSRPPSQARVTVPNSGGHAYMLRLHRHKSTSRTAMSNPITFMPVVDPLIKICGVTNAEDATCAVKSGANLVGMIMWPKAKRAVSDTVARQISDVARQHQALPVGVFVDESAETIVQRCTAAGIEVAQLHGDGARANLQALQSSGLKIVYVMHATPDGRLVTPLPPPDTVDWLLVDGLQGGSGQALEWTNLQPPWGVARKGWLLAGGLKPENVRTAVCLARPTGVDVSSGVCGSDGLKKDPRKIEAFVAAVKSATAPR